MIAATRHHADRPLVFTVAVGKTSHCVRAHRIHPVGQVLDGGRSGPAEGSGGDLDDFSWGHDVDDAPEGLMMEPPRVRRRERLRSTRAACYQVSAGE